MVLEVVLFLYDLPFWCVAEYIDMLACSVQFFVSALFKMGFVPLGA